ncbi:MAG: phage major capsid protein, partial [Mogibacterium sp.]|nr:phage major capsid protein [Mogibacterium sp.]
MADLKSLVEQRNDLVQQMKDLTSAVETEQRAFTDDENATFQECEKKIAALDATIAAQERARE